MNSIAENPVLSPQKRKQLHGPRPAPLTVSKSSIKIRKPFPIPSRKSRSPVIIYLQSPKVIHVRPEEFMCTVQRLTGNQAPSDAAASSHSYSSTSCVMAADETMGMGSSSNGKVSKYYNGGAAIWC
ncbi:protein MKS1-like [Juglans microcarpa x Juglans regia]|uniref:protein MKS1-like n=1 Tax=Juglans microcarpa x Juglans regia TaxID=2249226 RepID=UPI001B7DFCAC|nr:protein MKS1-like [Juglans microcarpa x Juglans regia]